VKQELRDMAEELARRLFATGRSHALSAALLHRSSREEGHRLKLEDPDLFAFNGTYSLSLHYLLGLGLELMLKAAVAHHERLADERGLREIGHDLVQALDRAEEAGFRSDAPRLREMVEVLSEPFKAHWFRYDRPESFALPGEFSQVLEMLCVLDNELQAMLWTEDEMAAFAEGEGS
jgi:hypothetical protein